MKNIIMQASKFVTDKLYNVNMIGDKSVFEQKRLLIIANHPSFLDGILLGLYLPVKPVFLVHTTVKERPIFRQFAKMVDTFEVDPYSPFAIKSIIRLLESGRSVVIFPEERKGESLILFTTDQELTREQLVTVCRTLGCSELSIPKQIKVLDKIPMLGTGKVDYVSLKNLLSYC